MFGFGNLAFMPPLFFVLCFIGLGGILGSFVNAAVYRLPRDISLLKRSRSFCPKCEKQISWYDNLPILSYLFLFGKCRSCKQPIPMRYLIIELIVASLFAAASYQYFALNTPFGRVPSGEPFIWLVVQCILIVDLTCATFTDLEAWIIPLETTWLFMIVGMILAPIFPELHVSAVGWTKNARVDALIDSFQGIVIGAGILWWVGFVCLLVLRKEGMGGGDAHLVGMVGAMLGWKAALLTLGVGLVFGLVIGLSGICWDKYQQYRLKDQWKPRQPAFPLPPEEEQNAPLMDWLLIVMGLIVIGFEVPLFQWWTLLANSPTSTVSSGELLVMFVGPVFGFVIGSTLLSSYLVVRHWRKTNRTPVGEIVTKEDGSKEEVLKGNYMPFGPSLALGALVVAFYDPLLRSYFDWWFFYRQSGMTFSAYGRTIYALPYTLLGQ